MQTEDLAHLDWLEILRRLESFATSEAGRSALQSLQPLEEESQALADFSRTQELQGLLNQGQRPYMESLDLFQLWYQRLTRQAHLKPLELKDVRHFCLEVMALKAALSESRGPWLNEVAGQLFDAQEPLAAIDQLMTAEGEIRTDASETLFKLHREKTQQTKTLQNTLDRLIHQQQMEPILQDKYVTTREGRWVLPVKGGMQHQFEGIIHASSQSKQTVFMEPKEVIALNNRLNEIEAEIESEVERLLTELSQYLHQLCPQMEITRSKMTDCDRYLAQAQLANHLEAQPCRFSDHELHLLEVRHPLLVLNHENVVANTVHLSMDRPILLLSGPNAGGKTVLLKSIGLAAHMARCGLLICAEPQAKIPFFRQLHISVGDSQSVDAHLSTFAAHLKVLNQAAEASGPEHLLLIDEICGSTDPEEGAALARSFIQAYSKNRVFAVVTSHLGPLKSGWNETSGVINGSLEYDSQSGRPTYQFLMGVPGQSLAIQTARRVGVSQEILQRALEHLSPEQQLYQENLVEVEQMKDELRKLTEKLRKESQEARQTKSRYATLVEKFERDRERMLEQAMKRAEKKVDNLIENVRVEQVFRKHEELEKIKQDLPEVIKASSVKSGSAVSRIETPEDFARFFPPGAKVFAPSIGRDAVIQGKPNSKGEVPVLSQSMRVTLHWKDLRPPQMAPNPTMDLVRKSAGVVSSAALEGDRVVDLRGLSSEEALEQLEIQLDTAALHQEERVKVVHGHGTESLKRAVRSYLSRSVYVKKWESGTPESGGDGVTWVEITDGD